MTDQYRIVNLRAENIKKLTAIDITPDPDSPAVVVTGENGAGKSSVLDCILWAIAGKDSIDAKPIRDGEDKGVIELDLGDYKVKRTFTEASTYLTVEAKDGARYPSPQKLLDGIMGAISIDPLAFSRMKEADQYEQLRQLVNLDVDVDLIDAEIRQLYARRTEINREAKQSEAAAADIEVPEDTPDERTDVAQLVEKINGAEADHQTFLRMKEDIERKERIIASTREEIEALTSRLEHLVKEHMEDADKIIEHKEKCVTTDELDAWKKELTESATTNESVSNKIRKQKLTELANKEKERSERLTQEIEERTEAKNRAIASADMPVEGLSLSEGVVTYNDIPLTQASTAEQIKVSTAIAMAMNPKLRVIRIQDGSLIDDNGMTALKELASAENFQLWIERVSDSDPSAIIIQDGAVV